MFLLLLAHPGSPGQTAVKRLLLLLYIQTETATNNVVLAPPIVYFCSNNNVQMSTKVTEVEQTDRHSVLSKAQSKEEDQGNDDQRHSHNHDG